MEELNIKQKKSAEFTGKHLLVLAGAGTGKTKTIVARASYLISTGVEPRKIQILTFTKKAAAEIVNRVESSANSKGQRVNGSTFHAWCNHLLLKFPRIFGLRNFTIMDPDDQLGFMKLICGKQGLIYEKSKVKPQQLLDIYSYMRNTKVNLSTAIKSVHFKNFESDENEKILEEIKPKIEVILKEYQNRKSLKSYLDYDDILIVVAKKLQSDPVVRKIISEEYNHILVDEMQDTNPLQWDLLKPFVESSHLYCVGDDAQSIYAFRGADFKNIHNFAQNVENSEVYKLEDNYRSTQEILDLCNWLLENSKTKYDKKLVAVRGIGNKPIICNVEDEWQEANFIADKIEENFAENGKKYNDHLILSRSQNSTRQIQAVFLERHIPFVVFGGRKFMESAHIKDVFSAMRAVNNYQDELAWVRFLTLWEGIGEKKAYKYIEGVQELDDIEKVITFWNSLQSETEKKIAKTLNDIYLKRNDLSEAISSAYDNMENMFMLKYAEDWENKRKPDFPVLKVLAGKYRSLNEFISEMLLDDTKTLNKGLIEESDAKDYVIISTIHSAKGLEADTCFVIRVSPGEFPSAFSLGSEEKIEEERRLLYVALTRAKDHLYIFRSKTSVYAETSGTLVNPDKEAYFLNGLPENLVDQISTDNSTFTISEKGISKNLDLVDGNDWS